MGADMKRAIIKLYDKLHLSHPMWSVRKICVEISEIFSVSSKRHLSIILKSVSVFGLERIYYYLFTLIVTTTKNIVGAV
jgi:hypothetical protein